jgi:hypothetical protein
MTYVQCADLNGAPFNCRRATCSSLYLLLTTIVLKVKSPRVAVLPRLPWYGVRVYTRLPSRERLDVANGALCEVSATRRRSAVSTGIKVDAFAGGGRLRGLRCRRKHDVHWRVGPGPSLALHVVNLPAASRPVSEDM